MLCLAWVILLFISIINPCDARPNQDGPPIEHEAGWNGKLSFRLRGPLGWALYGFIALFDLIPLIVTGVGSVQLTQGLYGGLGFGGYL